MRLLRARWVIVCATLVVVVAGVVAVTLLTTPLYQASTRLFVSTSAGASASDANQIYERHFVVPSARSSPTPSYSRADPWLSALSTNFTWI